MTKKAYPQILIIGTGGIGGLYGGLLYNVTKSVTLAANKDFPFVKKSGIKINSTLGSFYIPPTAIIEVGSKSTHSFDYIILTTKALDSIPYHAIIAPYLSTHTQLICLQNGINIEDQYTTLFPKTNLISGVAFVCSTRTEPGLINHIDHGSIVLGNYPSGVSDQCLLLTDLFNQTGINATTSNNIQTIRWKKLVWNTAFNGLSVTKKGASTQEISLKPELTKIAKNLMEETVNVARAAQVPLPDSLVEKNIEMTQKIPAYKTSMLIDYENKRPMEIEAIYGNLLSEAKKHNVSVPNLESIYNQLIDLEKSNNDD